MQGPDFGLHCKNGLRCPLGASSFGQWEHNLAAVVAYLNHIGNRSAARAKRSPDTRASDDPWLNRLAFGSFDAAARPDSRSIKDI